MALIDLGAAVESKPIREVAYDTLKHAIVTGEIPAGARIVETEYADRMHISRTPLREALRKLERDGLVEYVLRRGVVVRAFTVEDVEEIYTIRNSLEMLTLPPSSSTPRLTTSMPTPRPENSVTWALVEKPGISRKLRISLWEYSTSG